MSEHPPVIGMDTNSFGFHVVSSTPISMPIHAKLPDEPVSEIGWFVSPGRADFYDRLNVIHRAGLSFFSTLPKASSIFCEEALILPKNPDTTRKLVMVTGVLYAAFMECYPDASWFWVNVSTWRRDVLAPAKGESPRNKEGWKALAREHVQTRWGPAPGLSGTEARALFEARGGLWDSQPDLYDAACLMEYGLQQLMAGKAVLR